MANIKIHVITEEEVKEFDKVGDLKSCLNEFMAECKRREALPEWILKIEDELCLASSLVREGA